MHAKNHVKVIHAQHARMIHRYKNTKEKLPETNLAIWFNKMLTFEHFKTCTTDIKTNSYNKSQRDALIFQIYFGKELFMFRTDLLSIIRSLNTVFTAIGICHTSYVDCLPASCQTVNLISMTNTYCCEYSIKTPDYGQ